MTPVSTSRRAARLAPLASLDCSITDSRLSIVDTPTLNSYFECDQLSDMLDDSLFEITNTGCLSNSVFRGSADKPHELLEKQQHMPPFLYSSYDYSASSRIPIAAQQSSRHRTSTRHNYQYNINTSQPITEHPVPTPKVTHRTTTTNSAGPAKTHSKLAKTELKQINDKTTTNSKQQSQLAGRGRKLGENKKSKLGLGSFLGSIFDGNSREVHKDKNAKLKSSQINVTSDGKAAEKTASAPSSSMKSRSTSQRAHKKSTLGNNNSPHLTTSSSCNDFQTTCSRLNSGGSEVLLLDQPRTLQRPTSAIQLSRNSQHGPDQVKPETVIGCHQSCISTQFSEEPVPKLRPIKSVKFCMMDEVLTRPASSNPRHLAADGAQPASIIKRTSTVVKSSTCSQTESTNNLKQLLAKYDKNSELIREISEKLQLTDTIASPCSVLDTCQVNKEDEVDVVAEERALHAILHNFCKSDLNPEAQSTSTNVK